MKTLSKTTNFNHWMIKGVFLLALLVYGQITFAGNNKDFPSSDTTMGNTSSNFNLFYSRPFSPSLTRQ